MNRLIGLFLGLGLGLACQATPYYVATNGLDIRTGMGDWTNATATISNAVANASDGDIVWVSNGTYTLSAHVTIDKSITVQSFRGRAATSVIGSYPTISNRCFYLNNTGAVLSGFTISNGYLGSADFGGGVKSSKGKIDDCIITNCTATYAAGGIYAENTLVLNCVIAGNKSPYVGGIIVAGNTSVSNCVIAGNTSSGHGGGFEASGNSAFFNCDIVDNVATGGYGGGGIYLLSTNALMQNCVISRNYSGGGGGGGLIIRASVTGTLYNCVISANFTGTNAPEHNGGGIHNSGAVWFKNCLIVSNRCGPTVGVNDLGGGIFQIAGSNSGLSSCTIAFNTATQGGGIYVWGLSWGGYGEPFVTNSIIYSNKRFYLNGDDNITAGGTTSEFTNSFYNCCVAGFSLNPARGNITNTPQFVNSAGGNYRLARNSPCVNAGTNQAWMEGAVDLDGHARRDRFSGIVDMGCYEFLPAGTMLIGR